MKTTTKFWKLLPVAAAALALGGCGGGGSGNDDSDTPPSSGSIIDCFTANKTVSFSVSTSNAPSGLIFPSRSTTGAMIYNGQSVTGQTFFYLSGNTTYTESTYWTISNNGVTFAAEVDYNGVSAVDGTFLPQNMNPGQTATNSSNVTTTFVGFETVSLAGKTFSNTCHLKVVDQGDQGDGWYAPGYGMIKRIENGVTSQYSGDL